MKIAVVGSRNISELNLDDFINKDTTANISEIITGGAKGIDSLAIAFAKKYKIPLNIFLPDYSKYRKFAPLKRNEIIASYADEAYIFWDGKSKGTYYTISCFQKQNKKIHLFIL